ncbi:MAG: metallophosphoesterase [Bacteroidetes bacterium HGW-Bacteroidetes-8]|jgi:UDP-2,3-diacylglucosamine pyrophosphatase LpxH|nr:MAG: metallophosphoesterase [Bacteroidetes bacterium HGW-Bacteroidetes-8]
MKIILKILSAFFVILLLTLFTSCEKSVPDEIGINPFSNGGKERNMIVVLSDLHLGSDLDYAETRQNLPSLEKFLKLLKASANVKELVIAGDMLDEWYVPATIDTYLGKDQADFVKRIAAANKDVFDVLNSIIQEKRILVTYVPGNHDLTITEANVNLILPGINQARDPELGLGTYSPVGNPKIAIEHGHRYNFFCAPDPFSNQDIAPGTITPPGYFFSRIGVLHLWQGKPVAGDIIPAVTQNSSCIVSQDLLYKYWQVWNWALNYLPILNKFNEKIIVTNIDGFTGKYSVNDILPFQKTAGGLIDVFLYKDIQDTWDQRQSHNRVAVNIPAARAIVSSTLESESSEQAKIQYFLNPTSDVRVVVFGHTHVPKIETSLNHLGQKSIYANSGTWIDHNRLATTKMNFVVITPQNGDLSSQTFVKLYNYDNDIVTLMTEETIRF